jgi:hypothetical protein
MARDNGNLTLQLADIVEQLDAATRQALAIVNGLSAEQLTQRPAPDSWSVAECFAHLNITSTEYLPIISEALERAPRETSATSKFKMDLMGRLLKWSVEPPYKIKTKTTGQFEPVEIGSPDQLVRAFSDLQEQLKSKIHQAKGVAIDKVKITSPFNNRLKYNLFSALQILAAHERRHLWQAEQVSKALRLGAQASSPGT